MSNQINDGGAAFPIPNDDRPGAYPAEPGMSLRDYFAAFALQGMLANPDRLEDSYIERAMKSYECADAMLLSRKVPA
jgi:hypothetical protein